MKVIIDRIENEYAIVEIEEGKYTNIPVILIPEAKEGDVIKIEIDKKETEEREKHIQELMNNLFTD